MNEMTDEEWQKQLEQRETKFERKREIGQILTTFTHVGSEFIRNLINHPNVTGMPKRNAHCYAWNTTIKTQVEDLRLYTNKSLVDLGSECAVPFRRLMYSGTMCRSRKEGLSVAAAGTVASVAAPVAAPVAAAPAPANARIENRIENRFEAGDFADDNAVVVE
jgi:hypothetical protein